MFEQITKIYAQQLIQAVLKEAFNRVKLQKQFC